MKYIRTKDNVFDIKKYYLENAVKKCFHGIITGIDGEDIEIIKQADTIEELFDEFVWVWNKNEFPYSTLRRYTRIGGLGDLMREIRCQLNYGKTLNYDYEVFGAIWTEWGLKYVAKLNKNGELELI